MTTRELCYQLLEEVPDFKLGYVLSYLQGLTAGDDEDDTPNQLTIEAMEEAEDMAIHPERYKRYDSFDDFLREVSSEM